MDTEVTHLSAGYIFPNLMPLVEWYKPMRSGVAWYYWREPTQVLRGSAHTSLANVDEELRPTVAFLNDLGIPTHASCAGHFMTDHEFEALYVQLQLDEHQVRNEGLRLRHLETKEIVLFKDPGFTIPDKEELRYRIMASHGIGFFAFSVPSLQGFPQFLTALNMIGCQIAFNTRSDYITINVTTNTQPQTHALFWSTLHSLFIDQFPDVEPSKDPIQRALASLREADNALLARIVFFLLLFNESIAFVIAYIGWTLLEQTPFSRVLLVIALYIGILGWYNYRNRTKSLRKTTR